MTRPEMGPDVERERAVRLGLRAAAVSDREILAAAKAWHAVRGDRLAHLRRVPAPSEELAWAREDRRLLLLEVEAWKRFEAALEGVK